MSDIPNHSSKAVIDLLDGSLRIEGSEDFVRMYTDCVLRPRDESVVTDLLVKEGLGHGWDWFSLHANQRMQAVNFFLVAAAFLSAAYASAMQYAHPAIAAVVSALGVCFSVFFGLLEKRVQELVKAGERALAPAQRLIAKRTGVESLNICDVVETPHDPNARYSTVIRGLHRTTMFAFGFEFVYALWRLFNTEMQTLSLPGFERAPLALVVVLGAVCAFYLGRETLLESGPPIRLIRICLGLILILGGLTVLIITAVRY